MNKRSKSTPISARAEAAARETSNQQAVQAVHTVNELPAQLLSSLPETVQLWLDVPGAPAQVCLFSGESEPHSHVLADTIVFDGAELNALVCAVEADRIWHGDFLGLCFEKWRLPQQRLEAQTLLAGANPDAGASWSVERVLRRLGARLQHLEFGAAPRVQPLYVAA